MRASNDFFISYTRNDADWSEWIAWQLEQEGYRCVIQAWDFAPSEDFVRKMRDALDSSNQMIAVLSDDYFESEFAQAEMQAAFANSMLVPVKIKDCKIPRLYRTRIYIDLVGVAAGEARNRLLDGVRATLISKRDTSSTRHLRRPKFPGDSAAQDLELPDAAVNRPVLPSKLRVLFLGAEADIGLDIRAHYRSIRQAVKCARYPNALQFTADFSVTAEALFTRLNKIRPHIFHFTGKQDSGRILISSSDGAVVAIPESALAGMFRSLDKGTRLVILDTCYSLQSAREITEAVDAAIGVKGWIYDTESMIFYGAFYKALASGGSLKDCWGQAAAYAAMNGVPKTRIPVLCSHKQSGPSRLQLVSPNSQRRHGSR